MSTSGTTATAAALGCLLVLGIADLGFTYGPGRMLSEDESRIAEGKLRLVAYGSLKPHKSFVVTAYVQGGAGDKVTLKLPRGLELVDGSAEQVVPPPASNDKDAYSQVSWRVKSTQEGTFEIEAQHSTIGTAKVKVVIVQRSGPFQ